MSHTPADSAPTAGAGTRRRTPRLRTVGVAAALAALLLGASACGSSDSGAAGDKGGSTLRVGFISNTATPAGPEGWAEKTGTLEPGLTDAGISAVKFVPFKNGPDLSAAIAGGSIDLANLGDTPALSAKASGIPTRLINQGSVGTDAWLFAAKGGPTTLADLKGKTVATQVGSYMYRYLVALLEENGLSDSVKVTHVYTTDALASLQSGGIAAYAAPAGQLTAALEKQGFSVIDKASQHPDLLGSSLTVITEKALAAHPDLPAAWNKVRAAAVADMTAKSDEYYAFAATATGTDAAVIKATQPVSLYPSEAFTEKGLALLKGTNEFLISHQLEKDPVDLDAWKVN
ncbi:ABC transporter substrate-binding protein [Nocardioides sp.]|uniref:ABC transporter substrate-binding protein n=1 Tax=Nocardioides sp. TaxID=35761 RepID=UPI002610E83B|nr:ABC transporter substrate-binding protein [Nocardioides sp.]